MARPEKIRKVGSIKAGQAFKPLGIPARELEVRTLRIDELEAVRLADVEGLYQEAAAEQMGVSRPTFARILARARSVVARALVEQNLLVIGEGPVVERGRGPGSCPVHGRGRRLGRRCRCRHGKQNNESPNER
jgi:predicted DNA-binding protein (UPF0251 family)